MDYAVVEVSGKQYRVSAGDVIDVDNLSAKEGKVEFDKVLMTVSGGDVQIGKPYIAGAVVTGKLIQNFKGKKIRVARFTAKSRHRRVVGFRASLSKVQIEGIGKGKAKTEASAPKASTAKKTASKTK